MKDELCIIFRFKACWQNCEKLLLASSSLSVCPSVRSHGTAWFSLDGF